MRTATVPHIIDNAITRTMSGTIITHFCTQLMVTSMLFFGGETLHYFALALTIGILFCMLSSVLFCGGEPRPSVALARSIGILFVICSSVLVASPIVMWLGVSRKDLVKI